VLIIIVFVVVASHAVMLVRLITHRSRRFGLAEAARSKLDRLARRLRLNDVTTTASTVLVVTR
jgi:hypothetical protein